MLRNTRVVLVEDDQIMGDSITQRLELEGADVVWVRQAVRALHAIRTPRAPVDAVVCDIRLPDGTGEDVFNTLCQTISPPPFLFVTGQGDIDQAVRLMRAGAADYVTKPFEMGAFLERLRGLIRDRGDGMPSFPGISEAASRIENQMRRAADMPHPVLVHGPPGTGKIRIARRIHDMSSVSAAPFVTENLMRRPGSSEQTTALAEAIERARHGTLLLIAPERLTRPAQDILHEAMDDAFDGRVIATSDLGSGPIMSTGAFRPDLIARLSQIEIAVPPLRDRPEDAIWLLHRMFDHLADRRPNAAGSPLKGLSGLAEEAARAHDWPDNGREVRSRLLQAVRSAEGPWIQPADLFPELRAEGHFPTLAEARDAAERQQIVAALERTQGRVSDAARLLGVARTTLWEKMQKLGL